ncbi:MAG: CehA/McbA family metallohydrolase [Candidatus Hodarchaeota archaeon]
MLYNVIFFSELLKFLIWFGCVVGFVMLVFLIYSLFEGGGKKIPIPDEALDYKYESDMLPKDGYYIDLHGHTLASDGWMTPEQNIKWHIANGFDAFVLTDHNTGANNKEILSLQPKYPEILIIPGYEWTASRLHLNFIGIEDFPDKPSGNPSDGEIQDAITKAKALGAVVMVDHISWTKDQPRLRSGELIHPTREQLLDWGCDGFEINNEMYWHDARTLVKLDEWNHEWKGRKIFAGTGTDVHNPFKEWVTGWTQLLLTKEERENISIDVVKKVLRDGRTKTWQDYDYRAPPEAKYFPGGKHKRLETFFAFFIGMAIGASNVATSKKKVLSYVFWLLFSYLPLRLLFYLLSLF